MPTADALRTAALEFARGGIPSEEAAARLLELCGDNRVAVVVARQQFRQGAPDDLVLNRAAELLDLVLERLPLE